MTLFSKNKSGVTGSDATVSKTNTEIGAKGNHFVNGRPLGGPIPDGMQLAMFGMGCFWGVERIFWQLDGVWVSRVGYAGGTTLEPTYQEVCTGRSGHNEVVQIVFDPGVISYDQLLQKFWEGHDPTQGMRQGNDAGTQYRSGIYAYGDAQLDTAKLSQRAYAPRLAAAGFGTVTTEILPAPDFYFAEPYHQQYLAKNPSGYCGIGGTGVTCPIGLAVAQP